MRRTAPADAQARLRPSAWAPRARERSAPRALSNVAKLFELCPSTPLRLRPALKLSKLVLYSLHAAMATPGSGAACRAPGTACSCRAVAAEIREPAIAAICGPQKGRADIDRIAPGDPSWRQRSGRCHCRTARVCRLARRPGCGSVRRSGTAPEASRQPLRLLLVRLCWIVAGDLGVCRAKTPI